MKCWRLYGDQLKVDIDGVPAAVTAAEIIDTIVEGTSPLEGLDPGKSGDAASLRFSRYPAVLSGVVEERSGQNLPAVILAVRPQFGGSFPVSNAVLHSGHVVANGSWYSIEQSSLDELRALLTEAGVDDTGRVLTFGGLLALKSAASKGLAVEDVLPSGSEATLRFVPPESGSPAGISATLFPYQIDGWRWLKFVIGEGIGGLLADEMGLGKTLQVISVLADCGKKKLSQTLVVAPGSLLENWRREFAKFAPSLSVLKHHGASRTGRYADLQKYDVVVASYDTIVRDQSLMKMIEWDAVVLDEAQNIRNPEAIRTRTVKSLPRKVAVAMTGTPMENRLTDLWSIMDFIAPGYLGDLESFIARHEESVDAAQKVEPLVTPLMLRRRVSEVAQDLPARIDVPEVIQLSDAEAAEYERIRQEIFDEHGRAATLIALTRLRQFCAHPSITQGAAKTAPTGFTKFARLADILSEIADIREKAIVFTSYTEMADMIAGYVEGQMGYFAATLDGRLPIDGRQPLIDRFSAIEGPAVMVLNPKAGGAGLNITAATHVIHYNLEWNPALEDQASARAHRRGQTLPVTVHRLFCADTVEDVVNDRVQAKRAIAGAAIVGMQGRDDDYADVIAALERSPVRRGGR
ncbi:DEAD/DEAH box helicase [Alsobacter sp. SYSU M60028]|uniref:DEAD/DEAH box helicase n=1 Tax=Alsobacter ponti TaxID=2962936 RepID=A0ABT1LEN7_9HYPH|nr:DEAD/DEAH box helicase [Alsobacter ponti]MCP8939919.1 DEAD/DEAH box helicase [Alsobacter ponti]